MVSIDSSDERPGIIFSEGNEAKDAALMLLDSQLKSSGLEGGSFPHMLNLFASFFQSDPSNLSKTLVGTVGKVAFPRFFANFREKLETS